MTGALQVFLPDEDATVNVGRQLSAVLQGKGLVTLRGNLGGGKTTLCRGIIQAMGHKGAVKSPTYTLVEPYELGDKRVMHYDLYRLADPEELPFLGIRDYLDSETLTLIEWPERAGALLPDPDLTLNLEVQDGGRLLRCEPGTPRGSELLSKLATLLDEIGPLSR